MITASGSFIFVRKLLAGILLGFMHLFTIFVFQNLVYLWSGGKMAFPYYPDVVLDWISLNPLANRWLMSVFAFVEFEILNIIFSGLVVGFLLYNQNFKRSFLIGAFLGLILNFPGDFILFFLGSLDAFVNELFILLFLLYFLIFPMFGGIVAIFFWPKRTKWAVFD